MYNRFEKLVIDPEFYNKKDYYSYFGDSYSRKWVSDCADMAKSLLDLGLLPTLFTNYNSWHKFRKIHEILGVKEEFVNHIYCHELNNKNGHSGSSEAYCLINVIKRGYNWWKVNILWKKLRAYVSILGLYPSFLKRYYSPDGIGGIQAIQRLKQSSNFR
jgi:hypothetical protein